MRYCLSCRAQIPASASMCPACGKPVSTPDVAPPALDNSGLKSAGIAMGVLVLFIVGVMFFRNSGGPAQATAENVAAAPPMMANAAQPAAQATLATPDTILKEQKMRDDQRGATYTFYCTRVNSIHCRVHYDGQAQFAFDGVIYDGDKYDLDKVLKYQPIRQAGVTACVFYTQKGVYIGTSADDGNNFKLPALLTNEMTLFKAYLSVFDSNATARVEGIALVADKWNAISVGDKVYAQFVYSNKRKKWEQTLKGHAVFSEN